MTDYPFISVVISTRNRGDQLRACLECFRNLDYDAPWELVVVDNGSSDNTRAVVEGFLPPPNFGKVTYAFEPKKGLSRARNTGLSVASGSIIAFTDDDCYVDSSYLSAIAARFGDVTIGFVTGRIMLFDKTDYPATINESMEELFIPAHSYIAPGIVKGANMAFRRAALDQMGWFDELFGSGSHFPAEDCDAASRVSQIGWRGFYDPAIVVHHHHGRKVGDIESLLRAYDVGRGAYHMKLLLQPKSTFHGLQGIRGLPRRVLNRPASLWWEWLGAWRYLKLRGLTRRGMDGRVTD